MVTMEELLASQSQKLTPLYRGQNIEGEVVLITDKDIILDLGAKSEGVLPKRELSASQIEDLKTGSKLKTYVHIVENECGQTVLSLEKQVSTGYLEGTKSHLRGKIKSGRGRGKSFVDWSKFLQAQNQKSKLQGKVLEVNKGGLIVETDGVRGFLPNSQVGFELLSKAGEGMESLIGQDLTVTIIEVDQGNNKLIFSQRGQVSDDTLKKMEGFKEGQNVKGKIVAILPFGLVVDVLGAEGLVFISDVSWEKIDDLSKTFAAGQELEVLVLGLDTQLGRLNLSIKELSEDPFVKLAEKFPTDEVVKGEVTAISEIGIVVRLADDVEGFLPNSRIAPDSKYEVGKTVNMLVDSVDSQRRRINLAPFVTSTAGLIYK